MLNLPPLLHDAGLLAGAATLIYTGTVTIATFVALLARTSVRRRAAQDVLKILLSRWNDDD
jgi:hypothetical protein